MKLNINGEQVVVPATVNTVSDLFCHLGLQRKVAIVELNRIILEKSSHAKTRLAEGDRIEIVHFVGGG